LALLLGRRLDGGVLQGRGGNSGVIRLGGVCDGGGRRARRKLDVAAVSAEHAVGDGGGFTHAHDLSRVDVVPVDHVVVVNILLFHAVSVFSVLFLVGKAVILKRLLVRRRLVFVVR